MATFVFMMYIRHTVPNVIGTVIDKGKQNKNKNIHKTEKREERVYEKQRNGNTKEKRSEEKAIKACERFPPPLPHYSREENACQSSSEPPPPSFHLTPTPRWLLVPNSDKKNKSYYALKRPFPLSSLSLIPFAFQYQKKRKRNLPFPNYSSK